MKRPCAFAKAVLVVAVALGISILGPIIAFIGGVGLAIWVLYVGFLQDGTQKPSDKD